MEKCILTTINYQKGFTDGYKEGYNKALELVLFVYHQCINQIPQQIVLEGTEILDDKIYRSISR